MPKQLVIYQLQDPFQLRDADTRSSSFNGFSPGSGPHHVQERGSLPWTPGNWYNHGLGWCLFCEREHFTQGVFGSWPVNLPPCKVPPMALLNPYFCMGVPYMGVGWLAMFGVCIRKLPFSTVARQILTNKSLAVDSFNAKMDKQNCWTWTWLTHLRFNSSRWHFSQQSDLWCKKFSHSPAPCSRWGLATLQGYGLSPVKYRLRPRSVCGWRSLPPKIWH